MSDNHTKAIRRRSKIWSASDEQFIKYVTESVNFAEIIRKCGNCGNSKTVKKRIKEMDLDSSHLPSGKGGYSDNHTKAIRRRSKIWSVDDELFIQFVAESSSWSEIMRKCGYNNCGNSKTVKKRIKEMDLDSSHLPSGRGGWNKGLKNPNPGHRYTLDEILCKGSCWNGSILTTLKKRLIKNNIWEEKCYHCNLTLWQHKKIPLEVDHVNGDRSDNRLENLRLLCCNCHALTHTWRGRNVKKNNTTKNNTKKEKKGNCLICSGIINIQSSHCRTCAGKLQYRKRKVKNRPSLEELLELKKTMSMVAIGKKYGVSDNTIRKWIKNYKKIIRKKNHPYKLIVYRAIRNWIQKRRSI